jgi:hypothetical protein
MYQLSSAKQAKTTQLAHTHFHELNMFFPMIREGPGLPPVSGIAAAMVA